MKNDLIEMLARMVHDIRSIASIDTHGNRGNAVRDYEDLATGEQGICVDAAHRILYDIGKYLLNIAQRSGE